MTQEKIYSFRIPTDLHAKLVEVAKQERRSLNSLMIVLLEEKIDEMEQQESDPADAEAAAAAVRMVEA
jgi:hypothetical protein